MAGAVLKGRKIGGRAWAVTVGAPIVVQPPPDGGGGPPATGGNATATLTSSTVFDKNRVFNRDIYIGNPRGFSTTYNKGWGAVPVTVTPSTAVSALYVRLHDATDPAAQQNVVGSGAILQPSVAVAGVTSLVAGANTVTLTVPAGKVWYYADLALDGAMTHPIRVPIPFGVGSVFGVGPGTSHGGGFVSDWAYAGQGVPPIDQMVSISPFGVVYAPSAGSVGTPSAPPAAAPVANTWQVPGNFGVSPYDTTWAAEFLRLAVQRLGVVCGITGWVSTGGSDYAWIAPYDTVVPHGYGNIVSMLAHADNKWEVQMALSGANNAGTVMTRSGQYWLQRNLVNGLQALNKNQAMGFINGASPLFDTGDATDGWYWYHQAIRDLERTLPGCANNPWYDVGGLWSVGGHTTMQSKIRMGRQYYRLAMGLMGTAKGGFAMRRGPSVVSGTRSGTTVTLTVQQNGGTALQKVAWQETDVHSGTAYLDIDTTGKPDSDLAYLWKAYPAGNVFGDGGSIAVTAAHIVNATTITLTLASDPGSGVPIDVYHAMDFGSPGTAYVTILTDDTDDGDGLNYGRPLQRTLEPVYIAAPSPAAQSIVLDQPLDPVSGGWCCVTWTGAGAPLNNAGTGLYCSSVELSVNGGAYALPDAEHILNNNKGSAFVQIPSSIAPGTSVTIAARRVGQSSPDGTVTVTVQSARSELPDPDGTGALRSAAVAIYDASNRGTLWQDNAKTVQSSHLQPVRTWADALGDPTNDLTTSKAEVPGVPWLDMRLRPYGFTDPRKERPYINMLQLVGADGKLAILKAGNSNAVKALTGSFTFFLVVDSYGNSWFSLGNPVASAYNYIEIDGQRNQTIPVAIRYAGSVSIGTSIIGTSLNLGGPLTDYLSVRFDLPSNTMTLKNRKGSLTQTGTGGALANMTSLWLGGTFNGQYGGVRAKEMILFNRSLTDPEDDALRTWAAAKWPVA